MQETREETLNSLLRNQYENFPYPPVPFLALPRKNQGKDLRYEIGARLAWGHERSHSRIRILVVGGGTLEPLVVAQAHPKAREITTVDFSYSSVAKLRKRYAWARIARFPQRLPPMRIIRADFHKEIKKLGKFDYILASNVLHHTPDPATALKTLADHLEFNGILRVVTYPRTSRLWMRQVSAWLKLSNLHPSSGNLVRKARQAVSTLPENHPIRVCFETHPEAKTSTGIVDAFLNACENPLSPSEWQLASQQASLIFVGESHSPDSRSSFLDEVCGAKFPSICKMTAWQKLQVLDDLLEVCSNPILWFKKSASTGSPSPSKSPPNSNPPTPTEVDGMPETSGSGEIRVPSKIFWEIKNALLRVETLIAPLGVDLKNLFACFKAEVGPRVHPLNPNQILPGLSVTDLDLGEVMNTPTPWSQTAWKEWITQSTTKFGAEKCRLACPQIPHKIPGESIDQQLEWLQIRLGSCQNSFKAKIEVL